MGWTQLWKDESWYDAAHKSRVRIDGRALAAGNVLGMDDAQLKQAGTLSTDATV